MTPEFSCGDSNTKPGDDTGEQHRPDTMIAEVRAYWEALFKNGQPPHRMAINPRGIAGALPGAFIAERIAPGIGRLRVAGSHFTDLLGMDARGMPLSALFDPMARSRLPALLDQCFLRPAILDLAIRAEIGLGRPELKARMILLPLSGDGRRGETALGCLALYGTIGQHPRRLCLHNYSSQPLYRPAMARPSPLRLVATGSGGAPKAVSQKPDLRLVEAHE